MTTLIIALDRLSTLRKGDRITALDGHFLGAPVVVAERPLADGRTRLVATHNSVEHWLYPDSQVQDSLIVERPDVPRQMSRTVAGLRLNLVPDLGWVSQGRRFRIWDNEGYTVCELPHPVRTGRGSGYQCPGAQEHIYRSWVVQDYCTGDYLDGDMDPSQTLTGAVQNLVRYLARTGETDLLGQGQAGYR